MEPGIEKRVYTRFRCGGEASLRKIAEESPYQAKIIEVSIGGCLLDVDDVKLAESFAIGSIAEITFRVNGEPFRVNAEVRSRRAGCALGMRFDQLSFRTTSRLRELVQELEQCCEQARQAREIQQAREAKEAKEAKDARTMHGR